MCLNRLVKEEIRIKGYIPNKLELNNNNLDYVIELGYKKCKDECVCEKCSGDE